MDSGSIGIILGPMFSGKTTELMRRVRRAVAAKKRCVVIGYERDDRFSLANVVSTHDSQTYEATRCSRLAQAEAMCDDADVIAVDEGQFFPDLVSFCDRMADRGKTVVVAALDGTFLREPFGEVPNLVSRAEEVCKLCAICLDCGRDAAFSKRIVGGTETELIGGADKYKAVCRACYARP